MDYVEDLPEELWAGLCLCRHLRKAPAIAMGVDLADLVADVHRTLVPLYLASTCAVP